MWRWERISRKVDLKREEPPWMWVPPSCWTEKRKERRLSASIRLSLFADFRHDVTSHLRSCPDTVKRYSLSDHEPNSPILQSPLSGNLSRHWEKQLMWVSPFNLGHGLKGSVWRFCRCGWWGGGVGSFTSLGPCSTSCCSVKVGAPGTGGGVKRAGLMQDGCSDIKITLCCWGWGRGRRREI